jgi:P-type E1-E2 ATPase
LLSGDRKAVAQIAASQLGIDRFYGEMSPQEKLETIKAEQSTGKIVGMVGDGKELVIL